MAAIRRTATIGLGSIVALVAAGAAVLSTYRDFVAVDRSAREATQLDALSQALLTARTASQANPSVVRAVVATLAERPMDRTALAVAAYSMGGAKASVANALMSEQMRRDPRSLPARYWLLITALKANDIAGAITQLDRMMSLEVHNQGVFFPALAELVKQPHGEQIVARRLAQDANWREPFLGYLTAQQKGANDGLIFRLESRGVPTHAVVKGSFIQKLVNSGQYDAAYLAWVNFLPESELSHVAAIYDENFAGLTAPLPFNWTLEDSDAASVDLDPAQGLQIEYPAGQSAHMASQTLLLRPGHYRLDYVAHGSPEVADGGQISWTISCLPAGPVALSLPITGMTDKPAARQAQFTVPDTCKAQTITLDGSAGTFPQTRSLTVRRVAISRIAS